MLTCLIFSLHSFALETDYISEEEAEDSVVFQKEKNIYFQEENTEKKINTNFDSKQSSHCQELSAQIKDLVGKPLRKSAVMDQYNLECSNEIR